jgi:hypothetical protein
MRDQRFHQAYVHGGIFTEEGEKSGHLGECVTNYLAIGTQSLAHALLNVPSRESPVATMKSWGSGS